MAITFTGNLGLAKPDAGECNWDQYWYQNQDIKDFVGKALLTKNRVIDGVIVSDGGGLTANYSSGNVIVNVIEYAISASSILIDAAAPESTYETRFVWVDNLGVIQQGENTPTGDYVSLAVVDVDQTSILRIHDLRPIQESGSGGGLDWQSPVTSSSTAVDGQGYPYDTTSSALTLTLPLSPSLGAMVGFKDYAGTFDTNNLTIDGNGENIESSSSDLVISENNYAAVLVYIDSTVGWLLVSNYKEELQNVLATKPFFHAQDQKATGTDGGTSVSGANDRDLNTVLSNNISGASLDDTTGIISLPSGTFYIQAESSSRANTASIKNKIRDSLDNDLLIGNNGDRPDNSFWGTGVVSGNIVLATPTDIKITTYTDLASVTNGLGTASDQGPYEVYSDIKIWQLDTTATIYDNAPELTLSKPLIHVQDQKSSGTEGGASVSGEQDRDLNTVVTNEISGASLDDVNGYVTLPAGEYYIDIKSPVFASDVHFIKLVDISETTIFLNGISEYADGSNLVFNIAHANGKISLNSETQLKVIHYTSLARSINGLGAASSVGGREEVYSDFKAWKLDSIIQTPQLGNTLVYPLPSNVYITGNIYGLELSKISANSIEVSVGTCIDSTNSIPLQLTTSTQLAIPTTADTTYNIFLVRLTGTTDFELRYSTDVNGTDLTGIDALRWLGFIRNNASNVIYDFNMTDNIITFLDFIVATGISTTFILVDPSSLIPITRIKSFIYGTANRTSDTILELSLDGTNTIDSNYTGINSNNFCVVEINKNETAYFRLNSGSTDIKIVTLKLNR